MPPKNARKAAARRRAKKEEEGSEIEDELPPEAPPRPFKEIDSLPMSQDPPDYNILNQPLSIKDSAVLYSSLMKSRTGYTISNVFDMYWAKGKTKFDNDVNARDRMNKLCDCGMELGPHAYDVRFFILKDDEIEKKRESIKNKKKEKRMANKKAREEKKKIREMKKQGVVSTTSDGTPANPNTSSTGDQAPAQSSEGARTEDASKIDDDDDNDDDSDDSDTDKEEPSRDTSARATSNEPQTTNQPSASDSAAVAEEQPAADASAPAPASAATPAPSLTATPAPAPSATADAMPAATPAATPAPAPAATENSQEPPATTTQTTPAPTATPAPSTTAPEPTSKSKPLPPLHNSSAQTSSSSQPQQSTTPAVPATSTQQQTQQQTQQPAPARTAPPPPPSNDMMQTPESQMMIANLNAIARVDPSLNALMKIVASGSASSAQIREFQGYIQRAKAMGPTAYFRQQYPNYQPTTQPVRPPKPPKKPKQPKEKQLTTFQEMYVSGADLVFEFSESPNVRFSLPKDAIVEKNEKGDFIVSFLVIYNDEKIKKWKARQQVKKEKAEKAKELEEKKKREQEEAENIKAEKVKAEETKQLEVRSSRRSSRAVKKKTEEEEAAEAEAEKKAAEAKAKAEELKKKKEKEKAQKDDDPEPIPYYMPFSFKITNVDDKYDPIFLNSFHKAEETYKMMEQVMKVGVRAPKYLLWYQVDAFDDENLAETLREQLYLIENPPKKYKKRNVSTFDPIPFYFIKHDTNYIQNDDVNPLMEKPKRQKKEPKTDTQVKSEPSMEATAT